MKTKIVLEKGSESVTIDTIVAKVKDTWLEQEHKIKEIRDLAIYLKVEENIPF